MLYFTIIVHILLFVLVGQSSASALQQVEMLPPPLKAVHLYKLTNPTLEKRKSYFATIPKQDSQFVAFQAGSFFRFTATNKDSLTKQILYFANDILKRKDILELTKAHSIFSSSWEDGSASFHRLLDSLRLELLRAIRIIAQNENYKYADSIDWNDYSSKHFRYSMSLVFEAGQSDLHNNLPLAEQLYRQAIEEASKYPQYTSEQHVKAQALNALGYVLFRQGKNKEALESCHQSFKIRQKLSAHTETIWTWRNLALIHAKLHSYDSAIYYYKQIDKNLPDMYQYYSPQQLLDSTIRENVQRDTEYYIRFYQQIALAMADSYRQQGNIDAALAIADSVIATVNTMKIGRDGVTAAKLLKLTIFVQKGLWDNAQSILNNLDTLISTDYSSARNEYILTSYKDYLTLRMKVLSHFGKSAEMLSTFEHYARFSDSLLQDFDTRWQRLLYAEQAIGKADLRILSEQEQNVQLQYQLYGSIGFAFLLVIIFTIATLYISALKKNKVLLEQREEQRKTMTRVIVHDLKNPLTPIIRASEFLVASLSTENHIHCALIIHNASLHMKSTIESLLRSSDDTPQSNDKELLDIQELIESIVELFSYYARAKEQTLSCTIDSEQLYLAEGNSSRLAIAFYNIFDNAVKYTPKGGDISVTLTTTDNSLLLKVINTGQGFSDQTTPTAHGETSHGIGLQSIRDTVAEHGGSFDAQNNPDGGGAVVSITLPRAQLSKKFAQSAKQIGI